MNLRSIAAVVGLGVAIVTAADAQPIRPGGQTPPINSAVMGVKGPLTVNAPPNGPANVQAGDGKLAGAPKMISWGYLRTHEPTLAASALAAIQDGKLPKGALESYGTPAVRAQALAGKWATVPKPTKPIQLQVLGTAPGAVTELVGPSSWQAATSHSVGSTALVPEASPATISIGDVADKRVGAGSTWLTAPSDGKVTATLPSGTAFRIRSITSYDGELVTVGSGAASSLVVHKEWDSRKVAPFEMAMRAGQDFKVVVEFAPIFNLSTMPAGNYQTTLEIRGVGWVTKVPVKAHFTGPVLGMLMLADSDLAAVTYYPIANLPVPARVQIVNLGPARAATLSAETLPAGVTLEGGSIALSLAKNETRWVDVRFLLTRAGDGSGFTFGDGQAIGLKLDYAGETSRTWMNIDILEPWCTWTSDPSWKDLKMHLSYTMYATGYFLFAHHVYDTSIALRSKGWFKFFLDGNEFGNATFWTGRDEADVGSYGFVRETFKTDFVKWTKAAPYFQWHAEEFL